MLQNGVVVGGDGYGFVRRADGTHEKIPQVATVVIEDDVEIGANTTVDRPAVGETRIKAGAKIDNLVQIAHGVTVGRNALMAAQVGISGSTSIGDDVIFGGQVGRRRPPDASATAPIAVGQSGVTNSLDAGARVAGYPAIDNRTWRRVVGALQAPARAEAPARRARGGDRALGARLTRPGTERTPPAWIRLRPASALIAARSSSSSPALAQDAGARGRPRRRVEFLPRYDFHLNAAHLSSDEPALRLGRQLRRRARHRGATGGTR